MPIKPDTKHLKTKEEYRIWARVYRKTLDIWGVSVEICERISGLDVYKRAKIVFSFFPTSHETDIKPLFCDVSKIWAVPKVIDEKDMKFYLYKNHTIMEKNKFGIYEPVSGEEIKPEHADLILVPALSVDKKGHRLGYGKGFYDRFLPKLSSDCIKIVPIPEELILEKLPCDEFDVPVDIAVTQRRALYCKADVD